MKKCFSCGAEMEDRARFCPRCGAPSEVKEEEHPEIVLEARAGNYPMKWHNFQMVVMIIGAILSVVNGFNTLTGNTYLSQGVSADQVYAVYPGLKSCDVVYGIAVIALGVYEWIVRNKLHKFSASGPSMLKSLYIASIAAELLYLAAASSATYLNMFTASTLGSIAGSVIFFIINSIYYSRRKELFTQ